MAIPLLKCSFVLASDFFRGNGLSQAYSEVSNREGWGFTYGDANRTLIDPDYVVEKMTEALDGDFDDELEEIRRRVAELPEGCYIDFEN